jgi:hypothetical protein
MLSKCPTNVQLLKDVTAMLKEVEELGKAQQQAISEGNANLIEELHIKIQAAVRDKGRAVDAWSRHYREHGC